MCRSLSRTLSRPLRLAYPPSTAHPARMPATPSDDVTRLLHDAAAGDDDAYDRVFQLVYEDLRKRAHWVRRGRNATVNTTALVHEAYLHLLPSQRADWENRRHFLGVASRAMRQVLVAAARKRNARKRGGDAVEVSLEESGLGDRIPAEGTSGTLSPEMVLVLDEALTELERLSPRQGRVVECRFFAGMSVEETAEMLQISAPTVKRDWRAARAWLLRAMDEERGEDT